MIRPEASAPRTLIADDQPDVLEALDLLSKREGYQIETVNSPKAVLERLRNREYDVLLMDLNYALDTRLPDRKAWTCCPRTETRPHAAGSGDDRMGQHSSWRSKPCGAGRAILSKSRGRIRNCSRRCARKSNPKAAGAWARRANRGEIEEASVTQRGSAAA